LKLPLDHAEDAPQKAVLKRLRVPPDDVFEQRLVKRSIDARRRDQIRLIYSVDVRVRIDAAFHEPLFKNIVRRNAQPFKHSFLEGVLSVIERKLQLTQAQHGNLLPQTSWMH
jgi:uncharacterized FAD-dependent dehydrogenase